MGENYLAIAKISLFGSINTAIRMERVYGCSYARAKKEEYEKDPLQGHQHRSDIAQSAMETRYQIQKKLQKATR